MNGKVVTAKPGEYLANLAAVVGRRHHPSADGNARTSARKPTLKSLTTAGRVAVQRGPLVYCLEEIDQPEGVSITDLAVSPGAKPETQFQSEFKSDLLGGVVVLRHTANRLRSGRVPQRAVFPI